MPVARHGSIVSDKVRSSFGTHILDHLAAHGTGLLGGQLAVVALFQVNADLLRCFFTS